MQMNQITHWLDTSQVYGSNNAVLRQLRSFQNGLLTTQTADDGSEILPDDPSEECRRETTCMLSGEG